MRIETAVVGALSNNTYLVISDKNNGVLIDPGADFDAIDSLVKKSGAALKYVFLTHGHFDHIATAGEVIQKYGAKLVVSQKDAEMICDETKSLAFMFTRNFKPLSADILVKEGDKIELDELKFKFIETPGHSKGSVCIICGQTIFSGDTILEGVVGRTDFYGGSEIEIMASVKKLSEFPDNFTLLCGHGAPSTIAQEKSYNPYFKMNIR